MRFQPTRQRRARLKLNVIAPAKLGISCGVKVPVGLGSAARPYRVLVLLRSGVSRKQPLLDKRTPSLLLTAGEIASPKYSYSFEITWLRMMNGLTYGQATRSTRRGGGVEVRRSPQAMVGRKMDSGSSGWSDPAAGARSSCVATPTVSSAPYASV
jgi:hypothetical protein